MHSQEGGMLDETAMVIESDNKILMVPLNLYDTYLPTARMRGLADLQVSTAPCSQTNHLHPLLCACSHALTS
jgi:hypothetical protein